MPRGARAPYAGSTLTRSRRSASDRPAPPRSRRAPGALQRGRAAYERRAWAEAHRAFSAADRTAPLGPADLERLAISAYLIGRPVEFERGLERLHRLHLEAGDRARAARCAFWLGLSLLLRGEAARSGAWVARGQRLVGSRDCAERGLLLLPLAEQQLRDGKAAAAHDTGRTAALLGERFRDRDLTAAARHVQGRALIQQGQVPAGLRLLDEAMLAVVGGELSPIMTGLLYCSVIEACREVHAWSRAREWTAALSRWCEEHSQPVAFTGTCRVHRAEILQFHGAWADALAEAGRAGEPPAADGEPGRPLPAALYQQAEIHRLRGEFAEAEAAYRAASRLGHEPQPGLALLRLAQGRPDAARAALRRLVAATPDPLPRARLLPAHVEIMLAHEDLPEARRAGIELRALAEALDADVLRAAAAQAEGAIALADGGGRAALGALRRAFEAWTRLEAPYEAARARVLVGLACRALGDEETRALEFAAARAAFERLGARPELARLDALERRETEAPSRVTGRLTAREGEVLRLVAAGQTNRVIATRLGVSERTVDRHVSNILDKLEVPSRAAAIAQAYRRGLL